MANELFPIAAEFLPINTVALSGIYFKNTFPVLLVQKNTLLTEDVLVKLKKSLRNLRNIYVEKEYYYELLKSGVPQELRQEYLEHALGYDLSASAVSDFISDVTESKAVNNAKSEQNTSELLNKIHTVDPALMLQCINSKHEIDEYLYYHSMNVALLNGMIGTWLGMSEGDVQLLVKCGLLHDVGKTEVAPEILHAPRKLTKEEFAIIKEHTIHTYDLLSKNPEIEKVICEGARSHHEKMTGLGYPDGLHADEIPLFARITAISDVYDAMVSNRCYKNAISPFIVLEELSIGKYSDLDYKIMKVFLDNISDVLIGKKVLLSSGAIGIVKYVSERCIRHPIVEVNKDIIQTSEELYCQTVIM